MATNRLSMALFARITVALFALAPTLLFAHLGQYMRMMREAYGSIELSRRLDLLSLVMFYRNRWRGSFGDVITFDVLGPFDSAIASIVPAAIIAIWLLGIILLLLLLLSAVKLEFSRFAVAVALASLMLTATLNGFYSLEALYAYVAAIRYGLPLALAVLGIALTLELIKRCRTRLHKNMTAVFVALASFAVASYSEMHLVFQLTALPFLGALALLNVDRSQRRSILWLIAISWLATIFSGLAQVTAPGIGERAEWYVAGGITTPIRSLPELIPLTLDLTFQYVTDQRAFTGFGLLFAAGLILSLAITETESRSSAQRPISMAALPLRLGLIVQICFVPILWTRSSDSPIVLGRFSYAFFTVVCLNAAAMLAILLLLLQRSKISAGLRRNAGSAAAITVVCWFAALAFFALTQIRSIHYKAAGYLVLSALSVLVFLSYMYASQGAGRDARREGWAIAICFACTVVSAFVLLALANYSIGYVRDRVMTPISFLLVVTGFVWGRNMGSWLRCFLESQRLVTGWLAGYKVAGALFVVTLGTGIFLGRLQWLPELELYAREWDARHQYLLAKQEDGASYAEVAPLAYDMSQYFWEADISMPPENPGAERYYGIESIVQTET